MFGLDLDPTQDQTEEVLNPVQLGAAPDQIPGRPPVPGPTPVAQPTAPGDNATPAVPATPAPAVSAIVDAISGGAPAQAQTPAQPEASKFEMPAPPKAPTLTGDPSKDVLLNAQYQRELTDFGVKIQQGHTQLQQQTAAINERRAAREAELERDHLEERQRREQAREQERQLQRQAISKAVDERAQRVDDLGKDYWVDKGAGDKAQAFVSLLAGGIVEGLKNAAAANLGQVGHAENEAAKSLDALIQRDYQRKKDRLAAADKTINEARYGYQDAETNFRAALNDLDADLATKYRVAARETEAELKRFGVDEAAIQGNASIQALLARQAEAEGRIHEREEQRLETRRLHSIQEANANKRLAMQLGHQSRSEEAAAQRQANADRRMDLQERRVVDKELADVAKSLGLPDLQKKDNELGRIQHALEKGDKNALSQALGVMELDKAAKGGVATNASLNALYSHFGGSEDRFMGFLQRARNGQLAPSQLKQLLGAVQNTREAVKAEAVEKHDQWNTTVRGNPDFAQDPSVVRIVDRHSDANFGQFGFKRQPAKEGGKPAAGSTSKVDLAYQALDDKDATAEDKRQAIKILQSAGVLK